MNMYEIKINDPKMMINEITVSCLSKVDLSEQKYAKFFRAYNNNEMESQKHDQKCFASKSRKFSWFKKKPIVVVDSSDITVKLNKADSPDGSELMLDLLVNKIERLRNSVCLMAFEKKYLKNPNYIKFAPKEWWKVKNRCGFESSLLSQCEKKEFYALLGLAEKSFENHLVSLLDQRTHIILNS